MPTTRTIASSAVIEFWVALLSARIDEGQELETALIEARATIARFGELSRSADKETVRMRL